MAGDDDVFAVLDQALVEAGQPGLGDLGDDERRIIDWRDGQIRVRSVRLPADTTARKVDGAERQG